MKQGGGIGDNQRDRKVKGKKGERDEKETCLRRRREGGKAIDVVRGLGSALRIKGGDRALGSSPYQVR